jgi:hypothetical protein
MNDALYKFFIHIQKGREAKTEGSTWTQPSGRRVTKINGKIVPVKTGRKKKKEKPEKERRKKKPIEPEKEKKKAEKEEKKQSVLALTGDKYYTFFKKFLDVVKKRFGIGRSETIRKNIVEEHKKYEETGAKASFETFHASYLEYYKNKEKWDKYFSSREGKPKPEFKKISGPKKPKKDGEKKKKKKKPYDKKILKYLYELNKPKEVSYKQGESITLDRSNRFKNYQVEGKKIATGREDLTQLPTKNYISEETQKQLFPHQQDSVNLALEQFEKGEKGFLLADGTGAGKTRQAIALAKSYLETMDATKPIIIVTESDNIIETAWKGDFDAMGIPWNNAKENGFKPGMINITTYSQSEKIKDFPDKGLIIMDEAHNVKNSDSNTYQLMKEVMDQADHTFMASATPMDKLEQMQYICDALGMDFDEAYKAVKHKDPYQEAMNLDSLFEDITRQGLMVKREVPFGDLEVSLKKTMFSAKNQLKLDKALGKVKETGNKKDYMAVRRLLEEFKAEEALNDIVKDIEAGKQVVFFADRVSDANILGFDSPGTLPLLEKKLKEKGILFESIYGGTSSKAEKADIERKAKDFQSGKVKVILGNPESMGTGISLDDTTGKAPRTLRIMSTPYSAADAVQILGRVNRLKTMSKAEAHFYVSDNPIDDWNIGILKNKFLTLGATVGGDYADIDLDGTGIMFKPGSKEPPPLKVSDYKKNDGIKKTRFWALYEFFKIMKARAVKYYKRTGTKGKYKYYYTKEQWEKAQKKDKKNHKVNKEHPDLIKPSELRNKLQNQPTQDNKPKEEKPMAKEAPEKSPITRGVETKTPEIAKETVTPGGMGPTENPKPKAEAQPEIKNKIDKPVEPPKTINPKYQPNENQFARIQGGDSDSLIRFAGKLWMEGGSPSGLANAINAGRLNQDDLQDAISEAYIFAWKKHQAGEFKEATPATLTSYMNKLLHFKINEEARRANKHVYDSDMLDKVEIEYGITPETQYIEKESLQAKVEEVKEQMEKVKEAVKQNVVRKRTTTSRNEQVWEKYLDNYSKGKPDYKGIASEFGLGENQVKQIIKNTKNKLKVNDSKEEKPKSVAKKKPASKKKVSKKKSSKKLKSIWAAWLNGGL